MSTTIDVNDLKVGMFVHLDLGWWEHPFALSSFRLSTPEQIDTLRGLGLSRVRWSPDRSVLAEPAPAPDETASAPPASIEAAATESSDEPCAPPAGAPHAAEAFGRQQVEEATRAWRQAMEHLGNRPRAAREVAEGLTRALLDKMLPDGELCIRAVAAHGDDRAAGHALNVTVLSMLMARAFGFSDAEMTDIGMGALLHDVGKFDLPERVRHFDPQFGTAEAAQYRDHVKLGLAQGQRMGLAPGALQVIAQHHEMADGSGFPQRLNVDRMGAAARIVSLVNRYDNLCNPRLAAQALTPHEALSLIFAQCKSKFDASMLNAFIRMMGVYPPGSAVQLTDDRYALVETVNSSRPLKPRVRVHDPAAPAEAAPRLDLEQLPDLGIRRSLRAGQLPPQVRQTLAPPQRMAYFFEPALPNPMPPPRSPAQRPSHAGGAS